MKQLHSTQTNIMASVYEGFKGSEVMVEDILKTSQAALPGGHKWNEEVKPLLIADYEFEDEDLKKMADLLGCDNGSDTVIKFRNWARVFEDAASAGCLDRSKIPTLAEHLIRECSP